MIGLYFFDFFYIHGMQEVSRDFSSLLIFLESFIIVSCIGVIFWFYTRNKYTSVIIIPPIYYIISILNPNYSFNLIYLFFILLLQIIIILFLEKVTEKTDV